MNMSAQTRFSNVCGHAQGNPITGYAAASTVRRMRPQ